MPESKNTDQDLLVFDESSPLFSKKKPTKKKVNSTKNPRIRKTTRAIEKINPNAPTYKIEGPDDCKHILPAFKEYLDNTWKLLLTGTGLEASHVANYLRGVATMTKENRPKEYEELLVLINLARRIADERNRTTSQEEQDS